RLLTVSVLGTYDDMDHFRNSYSVVGADGLDGGLNPNVAKATRQLINNSHPELKDTFFNLRYEYLMPVGLQEGRSSEVASVIMAYSEILRYQNSREKFQPEESVAVTGTIENELTIGSVDKDGIKAKAEAAFFSWIKCLVVPASQRQKFVEEVDGLSKHYPKRELTIIGLEEPEAFFYDRRLSRYQKDSVTKHTAKRMWRNKFSVAGVAIICSLVFLIGWISYGPLDKNPVLGIFEGGKLKLYNTDEILITSLKVGDTNRLYREINNNNNTHPLVQFFDLDQDGINEVFWHQIRYDGISENNRLMAWSVTGDSLLWETGLTFNVNYPNKSEIIENQYTIREFLITNNSAGHPRIVANTSMLTYFPTLILMIDLFTGAIEKKYSHPGYFRDMDLLDVTGDETAEIIATGVNNAFRSAVISVLELDKLKGRAPSNEEYMVEGFEPANHLHYILVPKTIVGENHGASSRFNSGSAIDILPSDTLMNFYITDSQTPIDDSQYLPMIVLTMNQQFKPLGIGTDDRYDVLARRLYEEERIPIIPDFEYFEAFKDSLLYWDGENSEFKAISNSIEN
ncbi:MAG TPA: hypothetical protein VJ941_05525, partial [Gracilimonas sp.]|nr:hypothetical protein [Gracilimonas sp.]